MRNWAPTPITTPARSTGRKRSPTSSTRWPVPRRRLASHGPTKNPTHSPMSDTPTYHSGGAASRGDLPQLAALPGQGRGHDHEEVGDHLPDGEPQERVEEPPPPVGPADRRRAGVVEERGRTGPGPWAGRPAARCRRAGPSGATILPPLRPRAAARGPPGPPGCPVTTGLWGRIAWCGEPATAGRQSAAPLGPRSRWDRGRAELALGLDRSDRGRAGRPRGPLPPLPHGVQVPHLLAVHERREPPKRGHGQHQQQHGHDHRQAQGRPVLHGERPGPRHPGRRPDHAPRGGGRHLHDPQRPPGRAPPLRAVPGHRHRADGVHQPPGPGADVGDHVDRPLQGPPVQRRPAQHHLRGRGRLQRGEAGDLRGRRLLEDPGPVQGDRGQDPQGRAAGRPAGDRQDPPGPGRGRRGRGAVPLGQRLGLHGDVRGRRRQPGARPLPDRPQAGPGHHLRRRDRLHRPQARGRPGWRPRRARADAQPDAERDGRLRPGRGRGRHRRHQPSRHPRPGAAAPRPLRPPDRGPPARPRGAAAHPPGALQGQAHRPRRRPRAGGPGHPGHERRRPGQPGERGGPARRAPGQRHHRDGRLRVLARPGAHGPAARQPGPLRRGEGARRLPRGRPRRPGLRARGRRPRPQGDDPAHRHGPRA